MYPPRERVEAWEDFHDGVLSFTCSGNFPKNIPIQNFFATRVCHAQRDACYSEDDEKTYLIESLKICLKSSGIVGEISISRGSVGKADCVFAYDESTTTKPTIIVEFKSTQNLLLSGTALEVVNKYKLAYDEVIEQEKKRTIHWSLICHPIGQLLGYMVDSECRYGALTSATRTYFVQIKGNEQEAEVRISKPFFPGEINYLRAWAYLKNSLLHFLLILTA